MVKKKNIVLLHGWGASVEKLEPLGNALEEMGWRVLLLKLPGFDLEAPDTAWDLDDYVDFVVNKAGKFFGNERYFLFGHSFGGRIVIKLSVDKKYNKKLFGLILCSSGGISRPNIIKRTVFLIISKIGKILILIPGVADVFRKLLYKFAREKDYEQAKGVMKKILINVIEEDLKSLLNNILYPTLVLWGKEDATTPLKDAHVIRDSISQSQLIEYGAVSHNLPYVEPIKLAGDIDNWTKGLKRK